MSDNRENFTKYANTWYEQWVLPVIPAGAPLRANLYEDSKSHLQSEHLGKIPGKRIKGAWIGFNQWSEHRTVRPDLFNWATWWTPALPVPVCMRLREMPVFDCDINDQSDADEIEAIVREELGPTAVRRRSDNSPRFAFFYRWKPGTPPITKRALAWYKPEADNTESLHGCDFLGDGQHTLTDGHHAKGAELIWPDGDLLAWVDTMPEITAEQFGRLRSRIIEWVEQKGYRLKVASLADFGRANDLDTFEVRGLGVLSPLALDFEKVGEKDRLTAMIQAIDLDRITGYDAFVTLLRAIAAACNGDPNYLVEVVHPWVITSQTVNHGQSGLTIEKDEQGLPWLTERWNSFSTSSIGYDYVLKMALAHGYQADMEVLCAEASERAAEIFGHADTDGPQDAGGDAAGNPQPGVPGPGQPEGGDSAADLPAPAGGGPTPFPFTDEALADTFAAQHRDWRYAEDQGWVRLESGVYVRHPGVIEPIGRMCSAVGDPYRAQGLNGAKIDQVLKSTRKAGEVERRLRSHPDMFVRPEEFDAEPWLLNTPDFIVDLRDTSMLPHGMLMRQQTLLTPDFPARGLYKCSCPRWLAFLDFLADGRDDVVPFLRRWGAYNLVGKLLDQYFLFIHGKPGTGKSVFIKVLRALLKSYGFAASKGFFVRSNDKRTFELFQTIGKRGVFGDETMAGGTWDEIMFTTMLSGTEISAEGKGKRFAEFTSNAKITISGNHKPAFVQSSEEAGIDRRLLLLTADKKIRDHMTDNTQFADEILAQEGGAIMMWFVEEAAVGYRDLQRTGSFMGGLEAPFVEAAKVYRRESNPILQWVEDQMEVGPDFDIDAKEARRLFKQFMHDENPRLHVTCKSFTEGMEAVKFPYGRRGKAGEGHGRIVFKGLRQAEQDLSEFENVTRLMTKPVTKDGGVTEK